MPVGLHEQAAVRTPTYRPAQHVPAHATRFLIDGMREHRKRTHVQPDTRSVETHRRRPDLQLWLYPASAHPLKATHVRLQPEAFGRESASIPSRLSVVRAI